MAELGVSPLISAIMYLVISIVVIGIILQFAVPFLQNLNDVTSINRNKELISQFNQTISDVAGEGTGSARTISVSIRDVTPVIDAGKEIIYLEKKTQSNIVAARFRKNVENQFIGSEIHASAYTTITTTGKNAFVLENDRWKLTMLQLDHNAIATNQVIQEIKFKPTNKILQANIDFFLDDFQNTLDQNVTTTLTKEGFFLPRAEAVATMEGPNYDYNLHFTLESGADFLRVYTTGVDFQ